MSDLMQRLDDAIGMNGPDLDTPCQRLLRESMDEIERLRDDLSNANDQNSLYSAIVQAINEHPTCSICGYPATCIGICDGNVAAMCDKHCEHGNEDSICHPVPTSKSETERLQAIVDKLPKTVDCVPVIPGLDEVWVIMADCVVPRQTIVTSSMVGWRIRWGDIENGYSTREAAEKARTP